MIINLSPVRMDDFLILDVQGDTLIINGEVFDFSPLLEGATIPHSAIESEWFIGDVHRVSRDLRLTLKLPHGANASESTRFPEPITVTEDGPVDLPVYDTVPEPIETAQDE